MKVSPANLRASATVAATALAIAGCGGGDGRGDGAGDVAGSVEIERVGFPALQRIAQQSTFAMTVRNAGETPIGRLVVTLHGFSRHSDETPRRPLWLVDAPPAGSVTAIDDAYAAGALAPGARRTLRWRVTAVLAGTHEIRYAVAGARRPDGRPVAGNLTVRVTARPAFARVDPRTGAVVRE